MPDYYHDPLTKTLYEVTHSSRYGDKRYRILLSQTSLRFQVYNHHEWQDLLTEIIFPQPKAPGWLTARTTSKKRSLK